MSKLHFIPSIEPQIFEREFAIKVRSSFPGGGGEEGEKEGNWAGGFPKPGEGGEFGRGSIAADSVPTNLCPGYHKI